MPTPIDKQSLLKELADKEALLTDIEAGKVTLGNPFENREGNLRRRIAELRSMINRPRT